MTYRPTGRRPGRPSTQDEVQLWLSDCVNGGTGAMRQVQYIKNEAEEKEYGWRTVIRAKEALGFESRHIGASDGEWVWFNPNYTDLNAVTAQDVQRKMIAAQKDAQWADQVARNKAQSRALIANGWIEKQVQECFNQGMSLDDTRMAMAKQNRYLTDRDLDEIKEMYERALFHHKREQETKAEANKVKFETGRQAIIKKMTTGQVTMVEAEVEMNKLKLECGIQEQAQA